TVFLSTSRWMVKLYCSAYCDLSFGCNSPKSTMGRKADQSIGVPCLGSRMLPNGLGMIPPGLPGAPQGFPGENGQFCKTNGVLKNPSVIVVLPPNGGSAWNCSSTSCSMGL